MCVRVRSACWGLLACALVACSGGGDQLPGGSVDQTGPKTDAGTIKQLPTNEGGSLTCSPDETRDCVIDRGTFNGIHDCALGTQGCGPDGFWADCIEL